MGDNSPEQPAWGTPPRQASAPKKEEIPEWGSPPVEPTSMSSPARPVADRASGHPTQGTGEAAPNLLTADTIAVIERSGFMTGRSYELVGMDGSSLGYLSEQTSAGSWFFGAAASSTFILKDSAGALVATMYRPGSFGRFQFAVSNAAGTDVGTVEQENALFAPRFSLRSAEGMTMRLVGGSFGGTDWELIDAGDETLLHGRVSQDFSTISGLLGGTQRFTVRLSPALTGGSRVLAVMATVCLDYVRDSKKRR